MWDATGRPTIEVVVQLQGGVEGRALAPAGPYAGVNEAIDLRDGGKQFGGLDVGQALRAVNVEIKEVLHGQDAIDQANVDKLLIRLDGTANKARLGANAVFATSMAVAKAAADAERTPLWELLLGADKTAVLPLPMVQIFGRRRAQQVKDFMVVAIGADSYAEALNWSAEVYRHAGALVERATGYNGTCPNGGHLLSGLHDDAAFELLSNAIEAANLRPGIDAAIAINVAAWSFGERGRYVYGLDERQMGTDDMCAMLIDWVERFPIVSFEDALANDDVSGLGQFNWALRNRAQVVAGRLTASNAERARMAATQGICNAIAVRPNQAGTLREAKAACQAAKELNIGRILSARTADSEDALLTHLAVGWECLQLKAGGFARGERTAKWNEGLRIAASLPGLEGPLPAKSQFPWR